MVRVLIYVLQPVAIFHSAAASQHVAHILLLNKCLLILFQQRANIVPINHDAILETVDLEMYRNPD